jgi:hypothetical protein
MTATRRLAAIMAIDVVGYSKLMGEDEAGTALSVREHREAARPIVAGLGGRIVKTMGDGLLLEFPSVVAAVECAIAIRKLMVQRNPDIPEPKRIRHRRPSIVRPVWRSSAHRLNGEHGRIPVLGTDGPQVRFPPKAALRGGRTNWRYRPRLCENVGWVRILKD